ncbi:hypothetical protein DFJ63DRAFT_141269 [Scheffersomyces coipomensis]|uniref:uncharacterized protein n=1 Tax=Scheffersomyces coipomensis TaxID=1788519 RepID=UPI00315CF712
MENGKKSRIGKTNITRSKSGCVSCRRLRIKCDQTKPRCEYCMHTNRECEYPNNLRTIEFKPSYHKNRPLRKNHDNIPIKISLNDASSQLGISNFELKLLNFFHLYCLADITNGVDNPMQALWMSKVHPMFMESKLIRNSIFSLASLNLYPICQNLNESTIKSNSFAGDDMFPESSELLIRASKYFSNTLLGKNELINKLSNENYATQELHTKVVLATELSVSSMIIALFLSMHSHRILPLVSFDRTVPDYISICRGMHSSMISFHSTFICNVFDDVLKCHMVIKIPNFKETPYPILVALREDLDFEYMDKELSTTTTEEYNAMYDSLEILHSCIYKSMVDGYSVPLLSWLSSLPSQFYDLIYDKNFFSLRILYVYTSLTTLIKFQNHKDSTLWVDYMSWYKEYNYQEYGCWKYNMDKSLYSLEFGGDFKFGTDYSNLKTFNPEALVI